MNVLWLLRRGNPSSAASLVPVVKHESTAKRSETANIRTRITGATSAEHTQIKIRFNTAHRWNVPEFTSCYVCSAYKSKSCLSMHTIWVKYILEPTPQTSSHLYTDVHACVHSSITTIIGRSVVRELLFKQLYKQSVSKLVHHINAVLSASRIQHRALTDRNSLVTQLVCLLEGSPVQNCSRACSWNVNRLACQLTWQRYDHVVSSEVKPGNAQTACRLAICNNMYWETFDTTADPQPPDIVSKSLSTSWSSWFDSSTFDVADDPQPPDIVSKSPSTSWSSWFHSSSVSTLVK